MTSVTFLNEIFKFSSIGTPLVLQKQIFNGGFLYEAIFSLRQTDLIILHHYEDVI